MSLSASTRRLVCGRLPVVDLTLAIFWFLLFQYLSLYASRDPGSFFFDENKGYQSLYSATREREADQFIQHAVETPANSNHPRVQLQKYPDLSKHNPIMNTTRICAGIPTKGREKEQFLTRTVASLVDSLPPQERKSLHIVVLITEQNPELNPAFGKSWLTNMVDEVLLYSPVPDEVRQEDAYRYIHKNKPRKDAVRNEHIQLDYATLVEACQRQEADYFLLVEDDIIASRDWFPRLNNALEQVEITSEPDRWLYLRLFYTEIYQGWNGDEWPAVYLPRVLLVYVVVAFLVSLISRLSTRGEKPASPYSLLCIAKFHAWFIAFTLLFFMAGRVTVSHHQAGIRHMDNYGCCAQGLAFPARRLDMLKHKLRDPPHFKAGDSFIEGLADEGNYQRWAVEPSVFQHVGVRGSSDAGGTLKRVWSFAFEKLN